MRSDMDKTMKQHGRGTHKKNRLPQYPRNTKLMDLLDEEDGDFMPTKVGMKKTYIMANQKDLGYGNNYGWHPLQRFLESKIGCPWDEVYSEICKEADTDSVGGREIRRAIFMLVATNCKLDEDGSLWDPEHRWLMSSWRSSFYVDPETKNLAKTEGGRRWRRPESKQTVFEMDGTFYHQHEGVWYRVQMAFVKQTKAIWGYMMYDYCLVNDAFQTGSSGPKLNKATGRYEQQNNWNDWGKATALRKKYGPSGTSEPWYCEDKQSAGKAEIRKLKKKYNLP